MFKFYKYQSFGNDFVLLDFLNEPLQGVHLISNEKWPFQVRQICDRHYGIGADGILILYKNNQSIPRLHLFNADGSQAEKCFNGLRCAAHFLFSKKNCSHQCEIEMDHNLYSLSISIENRKLEITLYIHDAQYIDQKEVMITNKKLLGHQIDIGNPHLVILGKTSLKWLSSHGQLIEQHIFFPNRINVEFAWPLQKKDVYTLLIYERGCGITLSCGTGAAAVLKTLHRLEKIKANTVIELRMPGGNLYSRIDDAGMIFQTGHADLVFEGNLIFTI